MNCMLLLLCVNILLIFILFYLYFPKGLCVSCLFCFANQDVHQALKMFFTRRIHTRWGNYQCTAQADSAGVYVINGNTTTNNLAMIWLKRKSTVTSVRTLRWIFKCVMKIGKFYTHNVKRNVIYLLKKQSIHANKLHLKCKVMRLWDHQL